MEPDNPNNNPTGNALPASNDQAGTTPVGTTGTAVSDTKQNPVNAEPAVANPPAQPTPAPLPHGVVPDQVQVNQTLSELSNDLEGLLGKVKGLFGGQVEVDGLVDHLEAAADWVSDKLGLVKQPDGTWGPAGSGDKTNP